MSARLKLMTAGQSVHAEWMLIRGGRWRSIRLPAMFAWIEHPALGTTLFDTGYGERFLEITSRFPDRLYGMATPVSVEPARTASGQLEALGVKPGDVRNVIFSHFHADHIAGARDFPEARYIYSPEGYEDVRHRWGISRLLAAFLPGLLPDDFMDRSAPIAWHSRTPLPEELSPFEQGVDLTGDGSVVAVPLPGHTVGQIGLFVRTAEDGDYFLTADSCWLSRGYRQKLMPHSFVRPIFSDWQATRETLARIHDLGQRRPDLHIVPSHCTEAMGSCPENVRPALDGAPRPA